MIIRNLISTDITNYDNFHNLKMNEIDENLSFVMFDNEGNIESYIIVGKEGNCPENLYEEDTKSFKITDVYIHDINPFHDGISKFKRLFWIILTQNNKLSMFWIEQNHPFAYLFTYLRVEEYDEYIVYYKSKNYNIY